MFKSRARILLVTLLCTAYSRPSYAKGVNVAHPPKPPVKATYWEEETVLTGLYGFKQIVFYTKPVGPVVIGLLKNNRFHLIGFKTSANGIRWEFLKPGLMGPSYPDIIKRVKFLAKKVAPDAVERMANWPIGTPGFFQAPIKQTAPPRYYAGKTVHSITDLRLLRVSTFHGHKCEVLGTKLISLGSQGTDQQLVYWDKQTGFIWRMDDIRIPPAGGVDPPSRTMAYVAFKRRITRIPTKYLRFPPGTRYILPSCLGSISLPGGGTRVALSPDTAFLGYSLQEQLINRSSPPLPPNKSTNRRLRTEIPGKQKPR